MNLALVENGVITHVAVGRQEDYPGRINVDGKPYGRGWTDNGDGTFTQPPPDPIQYRTEFTSDDFLDALTDDEFDLVDGSNNPTVRQFIRRLELRKRMSASSVRYSQDIELLRTANLISDARRDDLLQGLKG